MSNSFPNDPTEEIFEKAMAAVLPLFEGGSFAPMIVWEKTRELRGRTAKAFSADNPDGETFLSAIEDAVPSEHFLNPTVWEVLRRLPEKEIRVRQTEETTYKRHYIINPKMPSPSC